MRPKFFEPRGPRKVPQRSEDTFWGRLDHLTEQSWVGGGDDAGGDDHTGVGGLFGGDLDGGADIGDLAADLEEGLAADAHAEAYLDQGDLGGLGDRVGTEDG